jgi:uncharacterized membrane protein (UPF0182 family)
MDEFQGTNEFKVVKSRGSKGGLIFAGVIVLLLALLFLGVGFYTKILQLNEAGGYAFVFLTNLKYMLIFGLVIFLMVFAAVSVNLVFVRRNLNRFIKENALPGRNLPFMSLSLIFGIIGVLLTNNTIYKKVIPFINATSFGKEAPVAGGDIGYYIFERPFLMEIYSFAIGLAIFLTVLTAAYYLLSVASIYQTLDFSNLRVRSFIRHILINIAVAFLIKAFSFNFSKEGLLYGNVVNTTGAGYVDVNVWFNFYRIAPYLTIAIVITSLFFIWKGRLKRATAAIAVFPAIYVLVTIVAILVQSFYVKPNEEVAENKYLGYSMQGTREAYGLNKIKNVPVNGIEDLSQDTMKKNLDTVTNIQVVDYEPTLKNNIQLQSNTSFYTFHDGDIVSYDINGKTTPVMISAREIDNTRVESSYVNKTFKYTHGYGIVINPLNTITAQGQVDFIMSGLVMNSTDKNLKVNEPRIYYGENTKDKVIVDAKDTSEIDSDGNKETRYSGKGGIKLNFLNRLLFSMKYLDQNILISGYVNSDSKILVNREITERVKMVAPFLEVDKDPYMVLTNDGSLKWVIDAYTISGNYPYAQYTGDVNYIRNSVKAVIDAYNGDVTLYIIDKTDPVVQMWAKAYPGVFSKDELPKDIASHAVYPEYLFKLQTSLMDRYHLDPVANPENVNTFYNNKDIWDLAKAPNNEETALDPKAKVDADPYYNFIKLPTLTNKEELVLMRAFTPMNKDNMVAWMAVRNSSDNYGEMVMYTFPKNTNIYGPYQVEVSINSIDKVSKDISLWNQSGSRVFKGSLLVVPVENSVLYVEPIYVQASGPSSIPQVREIVIGYQQGDEFKYGIGENLNVALNSLFTGVIPEKTQQGTTPKQENTQQNNQNSAQIDDLKNKIDSLKKQLDDIGKILNDMSK